MSEAKKKLPDPAVAHNRSVKIERDNSEAPGGGLRGDL